MIIPSILLILQLCTLISASTSRDPCHQLSISPTTSNARACLDSFPFSLPRFTQTITAVQRTLQLYVFTDTALNPPNPRFTAPYDVQGAVQRIGQRRDWRNDREWQEALSDALVPVNDGHLSYSPRCYRRIVYRQPFYPRAVIGDDGRTRIYVAGVSTAVAREEKRFLGREVIRINGKNANSLLWEFAKMRVGNFKDIGARFNRALAAMVWNNGAYGLTAGAWASRGHLPSDDNDPAVVEWTFRAANGAGEESIRRAWRLTLPKEKFSSAEEYWRLFCAPSTTATTVANGRRNELLANNLDINENGESWGAGMVGGGVRRVHDGSRNMPWLEPEQEDLLLHEHAIIAPEIQSSTPVESQETVTMEAGEEEDEASGETTSHHTRLTIQRTTNPLQFIADDKLIRKPILTFPGLALYTLISAPHVAVILVTTFAFSQPAQAWAWRSNFATILHRIRDLRASKIILDMSGNGGGNACLSIEMLSVLTQDSDQPFPALARAFDKDARASPLHLLLADRAWRLQHRNSTFFSGSYLNPETQAPYQGMELFRPPRTRPLAREMGLRDPHPYTRLFQDKCPTPRGPGPNPLSMIRHRVVENPGEDILVLTDGQCGSACGRVYHYLRDVHGSKAAVVGHVKGRSRLAAAFPAAQVFDADQLQREIQALGITLDNNTPAARAANALIPPPMPQQAVLRFAIRESYGLRDGDTVPLEYIWVGAEVELDMDARVGVRPDLQWEMAAEKVGWSRA